MLQSDESKKRLNHLLEEFDLWEAPSVEAFVTRVDRGRAADDVVEVL